MLVEIQELRTRIDQLADILCELAARTKAIEHWPQYVAPLADLNRRVVELEQLAAAKPVRVIGFSRK